MVGDQLFTDIWGANKSGIASILVRYLRKDGERRIGKKRQLEKIVLGFYRRNKRYCNRIGGIRKERDL